MLVRDAKKSDLSKLVELMLFVHQLHVEAHPDTYEEVSTDIATQRLANSISNKEISVRVAEVESEVVGYCHLSVRQPAAVPSLKQRKVLYLDEIVVHPEHQQEGVGAAIMADVKKLASMLGIQQIELDVGAFNSRAKDFFVAQGFGVLRERMSARAEFMP